MVKKNSCVFISGKGSNLKNLIIKSRDYSFPIKIRLVISNDPNAYGLKYAKQFSIPYYVIDTNSKKYENFLLVKLKEYKISIICLAGFMKIISKKFIKNFNKKIINIHPSLLPKFKGLNTYSRILKNREKISGCTVHYVNEKLDNGRIICNKKFSIEDTDDQKTLKIKTQKLEHFAFPQALIRVFNKN